MSYAVKMHSYVHGLSIDEHRIDLQLQSQSQNTLFDASNASQTDLSSFPILNGNSPVVQAPSPKSNNETSFDSVSNASRSDDTPVTTKTYTKLSRASTLPEESTLCSLCNKLFSAERYFKQHYNSVHLHDGPKRYKCMLCQRSFYTEKALQKHIDHEMQKTHNCSECERTFHRKPDLIRHSFVHRKSKPFTCSTCQKSFIRADQLTYHQRNCASTVANKNGQKSD